MRKFTTSIALSSASLLAIATPAWAQDTATASPQASDQATSDIIVTAQRKAEKVTEVPISITVANQAQLERQQVNTLNDLNRIAPSLEIQQAPGQNTGGGGSIRGIGTQSFSAGAVASVGVVVDQVSQGNANISDLFDVSRVEVLKGPQGTLFGLTTSAGVINITTNAPDPSGFSARVRGEQPQQQVHRGALASAVGTQQRCHLARVQRQVQSIQRLRAAVSLARAAQPRHHRLSIRHRDSSVFDGGMLRRRRGA